MYIYGQLRIRKNSKERNNEITGSAEVWISSEDAGLVDVPFSLGVSYSRGVTKKLDLGVRWESGIAGSIGAKYQFLGNQDSKFAFALAPRIGVIIIGIEDDSFRPFSVIPAIVSYHPSTNFSVFFAQEYLYLNTDDGMHTHSFSPSIGLSTGEKFKFVTGASYNYAGLDLFMLGAGLKVRF